MVNDLDIILKNFDNPDEIRKFEKGEFEDGELEIPAWLLKTNK